MGNAGKIGRVWATGEQRSIPLSRRGHITGSVPIGGTLVHFESSLERDFIHLATFDRDFVSIGSQPVTLAFVVNGKERRYTPDFLVRRSHHPPELTEIKYQADLVNQRETLSSPFAAARSWCAARGWTFVVWTELDIRGPRLANAKRLFRFRESSPCPTKRQHVLDRLTSPVSIEKLALGPDLLPTLWTLLADGTVKFPIDEPITPKTIVSRA